MEIYYQAKQTKDFLIEISEQPLIIITCHTLNLITYYESNYSRFAVRKVQTKKLVLGDFRNREHLKVQNDTKLILND